MLTNDFGNPFLTRSLLQFRGKMGAPFLALQNELDSFALSFHTGKTHLPHLAPLSQPTHQLPTHQQPHFPLQYPGHSHHPLQFLHPSQYNLHPSHYPHMYAGAAAAAAAAAAVAIEQSIPFSRHVMAVAPSLAKTFLPQALAMKNLDTVGIRTIGVDFHRESDNNNNNNNNSDNNNKGLNECSNKERQSAKSPTIEYLPRVEDNVSILNEKGSTRNVISQSVRTSTNGSNDVGNNSNNNHDIRLLGSVGPAHDHHRNLMFYHGREKSERGRKIFFCPQCHYVTDRKNNLKRHIITMHQDCPKILECCGVMFRSKAMLREHVSLFHSSGYRCQVCGRNFCRKALLRRHLSVHSGQKDFICPLCSYATSHKSNLERHQKVHNKKSTLNGIGVNNAGMKRLAEEELSKVSVVSEEPENSFEDDSLPPSQLYTPTDDSYLYRSAPIDALIGIPRIKKFLLPDRLNQTYTDTRSQNISSDPMKSDRDIAIQMMDDSEDSEKRSRRSNDNYRYRRVYNNSSSSSDSSSNGDNYHLYTHHHHHHHHHHHINTTVTSLQMSDNHQSPSSGKIIKRKPPRIFMTSYKCIDCRKVFSHQSLLNSHSCINERPNGESYLSIVRPLAKKQPAAAKKSMTLVSQRPTTSTAVVVVSTALKNWCEPINQLPSPSVRSQHQKSNANLGAVAEGGMVLLTPKTSCYSGFSPTLCSNTCEINSLMSKNDQTENNISDLVSNNTLKNNVFIDVSDDNNNDDSNTQAESHPDDEKSTSVEEYIQVNAKRKSECLELDSKDQLIDERKQNIFTDRIGWRQQNDDDNIDCKMKPESEDESEKELQTDLERNRKEETIELLKKEKVESTEVSEDVKNEADVIDDNDSSELEEECRPLPFKKRPIKEDDTEADEVIIDSWRYAEEHISS